MLFQLFLLVCYFSDRRLCHHSDEYLDVYANEKFQLKEAVVWLKSAFVPRNYQKLNSKCCYNKNGECGSTCQLNIYIKCKNFQTNAISVDVTQGFSADIDQVIRLSKLECMRENMELIITDGAGEYLTSMVISNDHRAQVIQKSSPHMSSEDLHVEYIFTYNCDIEYGDYCEKKCIPRNSNERCDPFTGEVQCRHGFYGTNCSQTNDYCQQNVCLNGAKCTSLPNGYACTCTAGYTGKNCENQSCESLICENNGICQTDKGKPYCLCPKKYSVGKLCEHTCLPACENGLCVLNNGVAECECNSGYIGKTCNLQSINRASANEVSSIVSRLKATSCADLHCKHSGRCVDLIEKAVCRCTPEWTGLECTIPTCQLSTCINGMCILGHVCTCLETYFGESCEFLTCQPIHLCNRHGSCVQSSRDSVRCLCERSFAGTNCEHECVPSCGIFGKCVLDRLGPRCECDINHKGVDCSEEIIIKECEFLKCLNGGTCVQRNFEFVCQCTSSFVGERCERPICNKANCNHGVCLRNRGCFCVDGATDSICSNVICEPNYCKNDGVCVSNGVSPRCVCNPARTAGPRCELACDPACVNGFCHYDSNFLPKCSCPPRFTGQACEEVITLTEYYSVINVALAVIVAVFSVALLTTVAIFIASQTCFKRTMFKEKAEVVITNSKRPDKLDSTWNELYLS